MFYLNWKYQCEYNQVYNTTSVIPKGLKSSETPVAMSTPGIQRLVSKYH